MNTLPSISTGSDLSLGASIAIVCDALNRCRNNPAYRPEVEDMWEERLRTYVGALPSGSGIDSGCKVDEEKSGLGHLLITSSYHCMDENGSYCGWVDFEVRVTWNALGIQTNVTLDQNDVQDIQYEYGQENTEDDGEDRVYGPNFDGLSEYLGEMFSEVLGQMIPAHKVDGAVMPATPLLALSEALNVAGSLCDSIRQHHATRGCDSRGLFEAATRAQNTIARLSSIL